MDDDEFLKNHWIMYYQYSRKTSDDYIKFLLDKKFTTKNVLGKINNIQSINKEKLNKISILDNENADVDNIDDFDENNIILNVKDIHDYVISLK